MSGHVTGAGQGGGNFETVNCQICDEWIGSVHDRHNGRPVVDGWVCSVCNSTRVIPARLRLLVK